MVIITMFFGKHGNMRWPRKKHGNKKDGNPVRASRIGEIRARRARFFGIFLEKCGQHFGKHGNMRWPEKNMVIKNMVI